MSDSHMDDRRGALLIVSLLLRKLAKGYEAESMKAALLSANAGEGLKLLEAVGLSDSLYEAGAALCQGAIEGIADMIEGLSLADDAKWFEVSKAIHDDLKAEPST